MNHNVHHLKTWNQYFDDIVNGIKLFEVRKDDRFPQYAVNDILVLQEFNPQTKSYSGRERQFKVTYKLSGGKFGIEKGYCVLGITPVRIDNYVITN